MAEATEKQIQVVVRAELEPETAGLRVRHAASWLLERFHYQEALELLVLYREFAAQ